MIKPILKDITIEKDTVAYPRVIVFEALTDIAAIFIETKAKEFGILNCISQHLNYSEWNLTCYRGVDRDEVVQYLNDLWNDKWGKNEEN